MGRARLDAGPDGRRPSDGCALLGVVHAEAIKVLTWVPGEPRRAVPHETIEAIIDLVVAQYLHDRFAVQMVFLILVLYYSFSRTECPCPKTYTGHECFDEDVHWAVRTYAL
jgi:hypothetical protein